MQFHNQERQLISLCEIRIGHGMKDAIRRVAAITESHNTRWQCLKALVRGSKCGDSLKTLVREASVVKVSKH